MRILLVAAALLAPALAHADQCALNDNKVNANALALVTPGARVLEFCEPCRERVPHSPYVVKTIEVRAREVIVNGKALDLAYLYVNRGKDEYKNVGALAGCSPQGVSLSINGGKPSGTGKPPPPMPPGPPRPWPSAGERVTSADDLAGTWKVKLKTMMTTCSGSPRTDQTWDIAHVSGKVSIVTSDGLAFEGTSTPFRHDMYDHKLQAKQNPSSTSIKITQLVKDRFSGTLVIGTPTGNPADPVCITQLSVGGLRQ